MKLYLCMVICNRHTAVEKEIFHYELRHTHWILISKLLMIGPLIHNVLMQSTLNVDKTKTYTFLYFVEEELFSFIPKKDYLEINTFANSNSTIYKK